MTPFLDFIAAILAAIYNLWENYAWAITGLTLLIMVITTPLTLKGTRSMMLMQQVQPEIKKLQQRYKDNRQQLNEEMMRFYKENNISPVGGCLPLLVQMPVFFLLYDVLRGLTRRTNTLGFYTGFNGGQRGIGHAVTKIPSPTVPHGAPPCHTPGACFDPSYLKHDTTLYQSLSHTNVMKALGMDLSQSLLAEIGHGILKALPYILLVIIVGITGWVQQKQIQGRTPTQDMPQQQQALMKIMPYYLPAIAVFLPAGLVLYFAVSNLYRVGQQWFIGRHIYGPPAAAGGVAAKTVSGGGGDSGSSKALKARSSGGSDTGDTNGGSSRKRPAAGGGDKAEPAPPSTTKARAAARSNDRSAGRGGARNGGTSSNDRPAAKSPSKSPAKSPAKAPAKGTANDEAKPVLQPRARKNKKG
jgi:YidC/Oxa1 family membrane protein insertase